MTGIQRVKNAGRRENTCLNGGTKEDFREDVGLDKHSGIFDTWDGLRCREWGEVQGKWGGGDFGSETWAAERQRLMRHLRQKWSGDQMVGRNERAWGHVPCWWLCPLDEEQRLPSRFRVVRAILRWRVEWWSQTSKEWHSQTSCLGQWSCVWRRHVPYLIHIPWGSSSRNLSAPCFASKTGFDIFLDLLEGAPYTLQMLQY